tara:strand:- start:400 stop:1761 length:1362 start_codon:yes stop_codon:yes gene_type:complete
MDAASKTGVDDVRELIDFSRYGPTSAKYKIFIIDEVHMLSKQAFNALLKTLEEPPKYLKFIFATTEIKKIPVTVVSRCQRFDLSRIKSDQLFNFIKKIKDKENGKASDDALKLIVKISEGSVRDALSLLDRGLVSNIDNEELDLKKAQKIFGYFDKSSLIYLFENLFKGDEKAVIQLYKKTYEAGVDPKVFLNDFLEILYYLKNISTIKLDGTNFSLNDEDFNKLMEISKKIDQKDLILFWQFTIETLDELNIVSNPNLSVEMFLIRLMYLKDFKKIDVYDSEKKIMLDDLNEEQSTPLSNKTVNQIKNISQKDKLDPNIKSENISTKTKISSFVELIDYCNRKKEIKLKYELENNINLVTFSEGFIEIAFNENLDKDFIKDLSNKLYQWTNKRWIISLSKKEGAISKKQEETINKQKLFVEAKKGKVYKKILETFPDAELINVDLNDDKKYE